MCARTHTHTHTHTHTQQLVTKDSSSIFYNTTAMTYLAPTPRLLGYTASSKVLEDDDKYMKRMSGVVRLFAAMVQCPAVIWGQVGGVVWV